MAKSAALRGAGFYEIRFFIFGTNATTRQRDFTTRLLNLGHRVKMVPSIEVSHGGPFGMRHDKRGLDYHVRMVWPCSRGRTLGNPATRPE